MTWTKLPAEFGSDPLLLGLPRGARLLHVEALVWCNAHGTDGHLPAHMLSRITDEPEPKEAAALLVDAGKWEMTANGWRIVGFLEDQLSAAKVAELREQSRTRQERWRNHVNGNHAGCNPKRCSAAPNTAPNGVSDGGTVPTVPTDRSDRNKVGKEQVEANAGRLDAAALAIGQEVRTRDQRITAALAILEDPDSFAISRKAAEKELAQLGYREPAA
jgi:hypothetical protein